MFLHPWAIVVGVLAAGLPVAVHFLTRPRPAPFPLSTLRFVREALNERKARHWLRDAIVLALRTAAVLLIGLAIARPLAGQRETVAPIEDADTVRVVILDASASTGAVSRGVRLFERARPAAGKWIEHRGGLRANLIIAGAKPRGVFEQPATNFAALRDELAKATPLPQQINVPLALNLAGEMLSRTGEPGRTIRRELIVVSDFQRSNWATADFSVLPSDTVIELESVAGDEEPRNLAVLKVSSASRPEAGRDARLDVEVGNYSSTPRDVKVEVTLGTTAFQFGGLCAPFSKTTLSGDVRPPAAGWHVGRARLLDAADSLPDDNARSFVLDVRPPPTIALVSRQPASLRPSSSYFLERALAPTQELSNDERGVRPASGGVSVVRLDPTNLDAERLAGADLIVLDHPGKLSTEAVNQLAGLLRRGRGVLYVAAESIDAANLKQLTEGANRRIALPVDFVPAPAGQARRNLSVAEVRRERSPFPIFGDELNVLLKPLRFSGGLDTRRREGTLDDDVLAQLSDRSALLVTASTDAGALVVLNADLGASNLPGSSMFVPLLGELTQSLLGRAQAAQETSSGEPFAASLPSDVEGIASLKIVASVGSESSPTDSGSNAAGLGELTQESTGILWKSDAVGPPGVYQIMRGDDTVFALATAIPAVESDLRTLPADVFRDRLSGGREVRFTAVAGREGEERDRLWTWAAVACVVCLLAEVAALKTFRT